MEELVRKIISKWEVIINSIEIDGYSRKVDSIDYFRMNKYYHNEDTIEWCYKVNFNLNDKLVNRESSFHAGRQVEDDDANNGIKRKWNKELEDKFTKMFLRPGEAIPICANGETRFKNSKVDYMTNQGYRFIIQFYPQGFIIETREEKLNELGI